MSPTTLEYRFALTTTDDPYPTYRRLRDLDPAHYSATEDIWVLTRFDDCLAAFGDWRTWSSERRGNLLNDLPERIGKTLGTTDPPRHTWARAIVSRAFTPRTVASLAPTVRRVAQQLCRGAAERGAIEFAADLSTPFNAAVLGAMFGVPDAEFIQLRGWLDDFFRREPAAVGSEPVQAVAMRELRSYLDALAGARMANPRDDLLSAMLTAEDDNGRRLTVEQVCVTAMTFLTAGFESTNNLFTNLAYSLSRHPEVFDALRRDPSLMPAFAEEGARWDAAAQGFVRTPTIDVTLHGRTIPAGAQVLLHIGAANRDERRFDDPDAFLLDRPDLGRHAAFGHGVHFCIGASLGRLMTTTMFAELLQLAKCWEVDLAHATRVTTPNFRGFSRLPLTISG